MTMSFNMQISAAQASELLRGGWRHVDGRQFQQTSLPALVMSDIGLRYLFNSATMLLSLSIALAHSLAELCGSGF